MDLAYAYDILQHNTVFRQVDTKQYNLSVIKQYDFYFVFLEPVPKESAQKRNLAFRNLVLVTDDSRDLEIIMNIFEFANSKGAVYFEHLK
jgi:hypothetical protein